MVHRRFDLTIRPFIGSNRNKIIIRIIINNKKYQEKFFFGLFEAVVILFIRRNVSV
jgi:hypothetical protein